MGAYGGPVFPLSAIVGQEALKAALLVNAIDPKIGGVLIRGHKGTAKSTAVRALAEVLPRIDAVDGCPFACDPYDIDHWCAECRLRSQAGALPRLQRRPLFVELPVSATEDRLVGTLDLEHALRSGERRFEPGLLARANRGILYVDEVNLLDDHLVDTLLDVAAMGVNTVEREGVSVSHPSRFILVGTMNPEEGEVRPQLLDRFGLCVEIEGISDKSQRMEIVRRRREFENDPSAFRSNWEGQQTALEEQIAAAQECSRAMETTDELLHTVATVCAGLGCDGHRADLALTRASIAFAALQGAAEVEPTHVEAMAPLVVAHRMRRTPFEQMSFDEQHVTRLVEEGWSSSHESENATAGPQGASAAPETQPEGQAGEDSPGAKPTEDAAEVALSGRQLDRDKLAGSGRRQEVRSDDGRGRYTKSEPRREGTPIDMAFAPTLREAARRGARSDTGGRIDIRPEDVRNKVRTRKSGASIVFCVDASGSMGATRRIEAAKGAVLDLLLDAYQRRDRVGLVSFRGSEADLLLPPTGSVELARLKLESLATGGATPLAHGIKTSLEVLDSELRRNEDSVPWLILVTDGRANVALGGGLASDDAREWAARIRTEGVNTLIVDTDDGESSMTVARELARLADGEYVRLGRISAPEIVREVRARLS